MDDLERKYIQEVRDLLSSVDLKLLELLKEESKETFIIEEIIKKDTLDAKWALPKTGKYQWYKMSNNEGKIRKCGNEGCNLFLKYNKDAQTYEHWKMDANTGEAFFVDKFCQGEI